MPTTSTSKEEKVASSTLSDTINYTDDADIDDTSSSDGTANRIAVCYKRFQMVFARVLRYSLLGAATWLAYSGIMNYADSYSSTSSKLAPFYVTWIIAIVFLYGAWYIMDETRRIRKVNLSENEVSDECNEQS